MRKKKNTKQSKLLFQDLFIKWFKKYKVRIFVTAGIIALLSAIFIPIGVWSYNVNKHTKLTLQSILYNVGGYGKDATMYLSDISCGGFGMVSCKTDIFKRPTFDLKDMRLKIFPTYKGFDLSFKSSFIVGLDKKEISCKGDLVANKDSNLDLNVMCDFKYNDYLLQQAMRTELKYYQDNNDNSTKPEKFSNIFSIIQRENIAENLYLFIKNIDIEWKPTKDNVFLADGITDFINMILKLLAPNPALKTTKELAPQVNAFAVAYGSENMDVVNKDSLMKMIKEIFRAGNNIYNKYHNKAGINIVNSKMTGIKLIDKDDVDKFLSQITIGNLMKSLEATVWTEKDGEKVIVK